MQNGGGGIRSSAMSAVTSAAENVSARIEAMATVLHVVMHGTATRREDG